MIADNPNQAINKPPTNRPNPFNVSETATVRRPPKIAYTEPINPISHTLNQSTPVSEEMPKRSFMFKIPERPVAPV